MIYLTFNDQPSGVYSSQVSDVCNFLNLHLTADIKLVAFISLHNFLRNRKTIKKEIKNALVLPAIPKAKHWKINAIIFTLICFFLRQDKVIARNVLAANIALIAKRAGVIKGICLDGRGAIAAEWNEYKVVPDDSMVKAIFEQEKRAVNKTDYRISVSTKLINYWDKSFQYKQNNHVVIPCTLDSGFNINLFNDEQIEKLRIKQGFRKEDIVLVYSGSTAGWQSFSTIGDILGKLLFSNKNFKLLFLTGHDEYIQKMMDKHPGQVFNKWVKFNEVQDILLACDYGILVREQSVTNQVASPTKFAEYLSAGLPVLISENLGDYTNFVRVQSCGQIINESAEIKLTKPTFEQKLNALKLAENYFTKLSHIESYEQMIGSLEAI